MMMMMLMMHVPMMGDAAHNHALPPPTLSRARPLPPTTSVPKISNLVTRYRLAIINHQSQRRKLEGRRTMPGGSGPAEVDHDNLRTALNSHHPTHSAAGGAGGAGGSDTKHQAPGSSVAREGGRGLTEELQGRSHPCSIGLPKIARFNAVGSAAGRLNPSSGPSLVSAIKISIMPRGRDAGAHTAGA